MKYIAMIMAATLSVNANAAHPTGHTHVGEKMEAPAPVAADARAGTAVNIKVNGLVCDFCAQAINKVFRKQEAVADLDVNLSSKYIKVWFKEGLRLSDEVLTQMVMDAGYNVVSIEQEAK